MTASASQSESSSTFIYGRGMIIFLFIFKLAAFQHLYYDLCVQKKYLGEVFHDIIIITAWIFSLCTSPADTLCVCVCVGVWLRLTSVCRMWTLISAPARAGSLGLTAAIWPAWRWVNLRPSSVSPVLNILLITWAQIWTTNTKRRKLHLLDSTLTSAVPPVHSPSIISLSSVRKPINKWHILNKQINKNYGLEHL